MKSSSTKPSSSIERPDRGGLLQPGHPQRGAEAVGAVERVAVLAVHRRVMRAREQQPFAVVALVLGVVLEQDLADLLVVRVVAHAAGEQRQAPDQRLLVGAAR